jgi:hypothetical protein
MVPMEVLQNIRTSTQSSASSCYCSSSWRCSSLHRCQENDVKRSYRDFSVYSSRTTIGDPGRDIPHGLPPVQTRPAADWRIRFLSRISGGEASVRKVVERTWLREPSLCQNESARPVAPMFLRLT